MLTFQKLNAICQTVTVQHIKVFQWQKVLIGGLTLISEYYGHIL